MKQPPVVLPQLSPLLSYWTKHTPLKNIFVGQPPYSPDLAPCDFFIIPKIKRVIKGTRFGDVDDIKRAVTTEPSRISMESFQECMEEWRRKM